MANGATLRNKVTALLNRFEATHAPVKFRSVSQTGGSALLDIGGSQSSTDEVVVPQPVVRIVTNLFGHRATMVSRQKAAYQLGDYEITFAGTVSEEKLRTSLIVIGDEVLKPISFEPISMNNIVVVWNVIARAIKPGV